jgi:Putative auto-transporter adhesin, head GIN domain
MKKFLPFLLVAVLAVAASCQNVFRDKIKGNGNIKIESRTAGIFSSVDVSGNIDLYVKQDSACNVKVEADENLMNYIMIRTEGDLLVIEPKDGYNLSGSKHIKVYVSSPVFKKLEASGACDIIGENKITSDEMISIDLSGASDAKLELKTPKVQAELSGAGSVELRGETKDFSVGGSGSSDIKCMELMAENVSIDISGAGDAEVFASIKLDVEVSGAGNVKYKGNATVNKSISGAGSVKKVE